MSSTPPTKNKEVVLGRACCSRNNYRGGHRGDSRDCRCSDRRNVISVSPGGAVQPPPAAAPTSTPVPTSASSPTPAPEVSTTSAPSEAPTQSATQAVTYLDDYASQCGIPSAQDPTRLMALTMPTLLCNGRPTQMTLPLNVRVFDSKRPSVSGILRLARYGSSSSCKVIRDSNYLNPDL